MKSVKRREEYVRICTRGYTYTHGEEGSPDSPRWSSRRLTQGPTPALCFASDSNLSLSPVYSTSVRSLALPYEPSRQSGERRAVHWIRWVEDAYESPGAHASEIFLHAESRRPNPHKSVALAGQERPFLAALVCVG